MIDAKSTLEDVERGQLQLRILTRFDCIRDRLSHFYYRKDFTALNAAVAVATENPHEVDLDRLQSWTEREGPALLNELRRVQAAAPGCAGIKAFFITDRVRECARADIPSMQNSALQKKPLRARGMHQDGSGPRSFHRLLWNTRSENTRRIQEYA